MLAEALPPFAVDDAEPPVALLLLLDALLLDELLDELEVFVFVTEIVFVTGLGGGVGGTGGFLVHDGAEFAQHVEIRASRTTAKRNFIVLLLGCKSDDTVCTPSGSSKVWWDAFNEQLISVYSGVARFAQANQIPAFV